MFVRILLFALLSTTLSLTAPTSHCTADIRLAGAKQVVYAYNLVEPGASAAAFRKVPFASDCTITMYVKNWALLPSPIISISNGALPI